MKDNFTQSILLVVVTLVVAFLVWGRGDSSKVQPEQKAISMQEVEAAVTKATAQVKEEMSAVQKRTEELNQVKELVTAEINKAKEEIKEAIPADSSGGIQDKIGELQDQIKDLHTKVTEMDEACGCPKKITERKCGCEQKIIKTYTAPQQPKPQPKVEKCEEKLAYLDCLSERLSKWDENCAKPAETSVKTAIIEKTSKNKESQISIIESKEHRHAMCLAPREFYREQCRKQNCQ